MTFLLEEKSVGHNARLGCSVGSMNFYGFDRVNWPCRSGTTDAQDAVSLLNARNKTELQKAKSQLGWRYSVLI